MTTKIAHLIATLITGFLGFVILGSMTLAGLWLSDRLGVKEQITVTLSADDILMQLAQSESYDIRCEKDGACQIALKKS